MLKRLICNLKMNHTLKDMISYKRELESLSNYDLSFVLCPATCYLPLMHSSKYRLCSQDVSLLENENNTGSISVSALKSLDVNSVLIGHSDINNSFDEMINKIKNCVFQGISVYIILSDTKEEYDYQYTFVILRKKIHDILNSVSLEYYSMLYFVYEPTFVIGTRHSLDCSFVDNLFYQLKMDLKKDFSFDFLFFYGGGLWGDVVDDFLAREYIDGILLGGYGYSVKNIVKLLGNCFFRQN